MKATDIFVIEAKYNRDANKAVFDILDKMSHADREKDRGSYYGSLSGLFRHVWGGTGFFMGQLFKGLLPNNAQAQAAIAKLAPPRAPLEGALTEAQWARLVADSTAADDAFVQFTQALSEADLDTPVKWFSDTPPTVPLHFMLSNLAMHNTHHRGQISQVLDELKIDNDYSGIGSQTL
jgi:uncharacterized damage-inducible protein DinB